MEIILTLLSTIGMLRTIVTVLSPYAVLVLLGLVLFYQYRHFNGNAKKLDTLTDNHLHPLPEMEAALTRIEALLQSMNNNIIYIRAKVGNGGGPN